MRNNPILKTKPPPSLAYIRQLEKEWRIAIPDELIGFFMQSNGGAPEFNTYISQDGERCVLHEFLAIGSRAQEGSFENVMKDLVLELGMIPRHLIPFAINEGGDFYCMSVKKKSRGQIYFFGNDSYDDLSRAIQ